MMLTPSAQNKRAWAAFAALMVFAQARLGLAQAEHQASALRINWWAWDSHAPPMGWFLFDFALFVLALVYLTAKPVSQSFLERHVAIKKAIADAAAAHAKASLAQADARQKLAGLEAESRELIETSLKDGEAERAQMVKDADAYAARMKADTSSLADQEIKRARLRLQARTMRSALSRARALLEAELDGQDQTRLLDTSIDAMAQDANWQLRPLHAAGTASTQLNAGGLS